MSGWKALIGVVVFGYVALVGLMYVAQRALMYFPDTARISPADAGFAEAQEIRFESGDGTALIAWHVPPAAGKPLVLYLHGNGGALRHRVSRLRALTQAGYGILALSYRGYGGSAGSPSEAGLIADGRAAYELARLKQSQARIVVWGESLGTGVATAIAAEGMGDALILEAPFTSTADIAFATYPFIPVRLLMKDQFRSDLRIGAVRVPLLVLHGERDRVVPIGYGERLFALANEPKRFVRLPAGGHEDLDAHGAQAAARRFIDALAP